MSELSVAFKHMRTVGIELGKAALVAREDATQRRHVVQLRRQHAEAVMQVIAEARKHPQFKRDPDLAGQFYERFSAMRSRIAVFQAKWPAVLLDLNDPSFHVAANDLRRENSAFMDWAIQVIEN